MNPVTITADFWRCSVAIRIPSRAEIPSWCWAWSNTPAEIHYGDGIHASKAIEDAGGLSPFADRMHVAVWVAGEARFILFDLRAILEKKPGAEDPILKGGDVVLVRETPWGF